MRVMGEDTANITDKGGAEIATHPEPASGDNPPQVQWRCTQCLAVNSVEDAGAGTGPWKCSECGEATAQHPEAIDAGGGLLACPVCGSPDLYRKRDFNPRLGVGIIIVGVLLAWPTKFISLALCAAIDFAIYRFLPEVVICYHCQSSMRRYVAMDRVPEFDLNVSDKYVETERERGW